MTDPTTAAKPRRRHPAYDTRPWGVYDPSLVGVVPGYPLTSATWEHRRVICAANTDGARAAGTLTRLGVPNGWSNRKPELAVLRAAATELGTMIVAALVVGGATVVSADCNDETWGNEALAYAASVVADRSEHVRHRLVAARLLAEYLRGGLKPTADAISNGEAWLEGLLVHIAGGGSKAA